MPEPTYWNGTVPTRCDLSVPPVALSVEDATLHDVKRMFVDGRTKDGPWAIMCMKCFTTQGLGLGTGRGQLYRLQPNNTWLKVSG